MIARYIETRAVATVLNTGLASAEAKASQIAGECPGILLAAPTGSDKSTLSVELELSILLAVYVPLHEPISGFTSAMVDDRLRWHDKTLQRLVYAYVREQAGVLALHPPNFCDEARTWAGGGYAALPAGVKRFDIEVRRAFSPAGEEIEARLIRVLRRHTTRSERVVLAKTARLAASQQKLIAPRLNSALDTAAKALGTTLPAVSVSSTGAAK
ncbi:MAG: hypothetical protein ACYDHT_05430 [Solirubrobacteraceae bacterium]